MEWKGRRKSSNVEDRRGMSGGKIAAGGSIIGLLIYFAVQFLGGDADMANMVANQLNNQPTTESSRELTQEEKELGDFVATVFGDTEDVWTKLLANTETPYRLPKMVLFTGQVATKCGNATSAVGPFYCPADEKVYMDLDFFEELKTRFGAKGGDFAIAYVIAHEVGHHVQNVLGTNRAVRRAQNGKSQTEQNKLSVAQELQADFYAGVFAHYIQKYLDAGDIDEALSAAQAVGDDAIQRKMQGHVNPDSFTHGTSAQRKEWFMKGFNTGDILKGNTFDALK